MSIKNQVYIILTLSILFTLVIQWDLTRAIFSGNYLNNNQIKGTDYYLSLINESSKGNWRLGSPYLLEWRDKPYLYPALNINAAGLFKRLSGLGIKSYALAMDYGAIFLIMALLLTAFLFLFGWNSFGYLAAAFYIFFPRIGWDRTLSPEINFIPLAAFLIFYFSNFSFWKRELGLAIFAGILFYIYPYYWTFVIALLAASDVWLFWQQRKIIWQRLYKYLIIAGLASWYAIHLWQISQLSYYKESMIRIGALYSRFPAGLYTQAILLASLILFFFLRKYYFKEITDKVAPGLVASLVVLNQQLITGVQLESNSHYLPVILIFLVVFWGGLIFTFIKFSPAYKKAVISVLFCGAVILIGYQVSLASEKDYLQEKDPAVVDWFVQNHIRDQVIYAPEELNDEINLLTDNYLYFHPGQELQLIPTAELIDRFTYFDLTNKSITNNLLDYQTAIFGMTFIESAQKDIILNKIKSLIFGKKYLPAAPDQRLAYNLGLIYKKRINPNLNEFIEHLDKYRVNYLIYRQADRNSIYGMIPGKIVFESKGYIVKEYGAD